MLSLGTEMQTNVFRGPLFPVSSLNIVDFHLFYISHIFFVKNVVNSTYSSSDEKKEEYQLDITSLAGPLVYEL